MPQVDGITATNFVLSYRPEVASSSSAWRWTPRAAQRGLQRGPPSACRRPPSVRTSSPPSWRRVKPEG